MNICGDRLPDGLQKSGILSHAKGAVYSGAWRQWVYAVEVGLGAGLVIFGERGGYSARGGDCD